MPRKPSKSMTYEKAMAELQAIYTNLEEGKIGIDELTEKIQRAEELVKLCETKLRDATQSLEKLK